ncbi:MAG: SufD family Fe-S cluster assembly protein [Candidatus Hodgkinia cicadicola]|nr:MAG: SufD family Fe-S cluster assembly protein [Candidatus Hodgkinia cicadicola]
MLLWRINAYYSLLFASCLRWSHVELKLVEVNSLDLVLAIKNAKRLLGRCESLEDVDVVCDSNSIYLRISKELNSLGIRFAAFSKAVLLCSKLIRRYMGSVVSHNDNYFAMLNSCLFTDGTFINVPCGTVCPVCLSTYFKISLGCAGQFERTLVVVEGGSQIAYFEGCNAARLERVVLHAAVVELVVLYNSCLKYTTLQNWYVHGRLGVYNLVTKRALCCGAASRIVWVQIEIGSSATWKYPSSVLTGAGAHSEFYSLSVSASVQQVDTGTKTYHLARGCDSVVVAKTVLFGCCSNTFRTLVGLNASGSRNHTRCDALVTSDACTSCSLPLVETTSFPATLEYESLSSYVTDHQLRYCEQRGIDGFSATRLVVSGYSREVTKHLPIAASLEVARLLFAN